MRLRRPVTVALLGLVVAAWTTGCGVDAEPSTESDVATVSAVLDGRTVEVERAGKAVTVTLLGIDPPALDECLGEDSAAALSDLLPIGAEVRLEPADDPVAAVFAGDVLVNAELARQGLAHAVVDTAITEQVAPAEQEAVDVGAGLFGTQDECTVQAQVVALEKAAAAAAEPAAVLAAGVGVAEVDRHAAAVAAVVPTGAALAALLDGEQWVRYPAAMIADLRTRTAAVNDRLGGAASALALLRASEEQRVEAERVAAEAAAAAAAAADEAARQAQAVADAEAARIAAGTATVQKAPAATSGGSVSYKNCDAVKAAGAAPILAGQPGYSSKLDKDGDGVGCEK
ncbi:thermonuclease family protein [Cellulomonas terrae]|uniref:Excalibur calcium-binding domain-containing protein n=1 Tax=Cellulomonas terrae TaxID=311234 RepID=A0A511JQ57_9CELL|nr:thermonuclease family protein [Cellulomonas terrae]GEM00153.1 hypothetical protein CTE05_36990 [Cellulomonas terrae]